MTDKPDVVPTPPVEAEITPEELDLEFVAAPVACLVSRNFDGDSLVVDPRNGKTYVLNTSASTIWGCIDGTTSLGELADEFAAAFDVDIEVMRSDIMRVARQLGGWRLLEGVLPASAVTLPLTPSLETGQAIPRFVAYTPDGSAVSVPDAESTGTLLVNWSPFCGYCGMIAAQLGTLLSALDEAGVNLLLLTVGSPDDNASMLASSGLDDHVLYRTPQGRDAGSGHAGLQDPGPPGAPNHSTRDPFGMMGTPVAYLLDGEGGLVAPLASGAFEVPRLARSAAKLPDEPEPAGNSLPAASGMCAPSIRPKASRDWEATIAVAVRDLQVGVRADSPATLTLLNRALQSHLLPIGTPAPANFSVVLGEPRDNAKRGAAPLSLLLAGDKTVLRSRSPRRVLDALNVRLSALVDAPDKSMLRTYNVAGVVDDKAVLLPLVTSRRMEQLAGRLARVGVALFDGPEVVIDPTTAELVVAEPGRWLDDMMLDELAPYRDVRGELPAVSPGRYPIGLWILDQDMPVGGLSLSISTSIAGALPAVIVDPDSLEQSIEGFSVAVDQLAQLMRSVQAIALDSYELEGFAARLEKVIATL